MHRRVQAHLEVSDDALDAEVGALSSALGRLKGMAAQIGEEAKETGKIQDAIAEQLALGQAAMTSGLRKMKRMHREMSNSCGHMLVLAIYAVVLVLGVVFLSRIRRLLAHWFF